MMEAKEGRNPHGETRTTIKFCKLALVSPILSFIIPNRLVKRLGAINLSTDKTKVETGYKVAICPNGNLLNMRIYLITDLKLL